MWSGDVARQPSQRFTSREGSRADASVVRSAQRQDAVRPQLKARSAVSGQIRDKPPPREGRSCHASVKLALGPAHRQRGSERPRKTWDYHRRGNDKGSPVVQLTTQLPTDGTAGGPGASLRSSFSHAADPSCIGNPDGVQEAASPLGGIVKAEGFGDGSDTSKADHRQASPGDATRQFICHALPQLLTPPS